MKLPFKKNHFYISLLFTILLLFGFWLLKLLPKSTRTPAQFSQSELQYAEILWEEGVARPIDDAPRVAPAWEDDLEDTRYDYSNSIENQIHEKVQTKYQERLHQGWIENKEEEERKRRLEEEKARQKKLLKQQQERFLNQQIEDETFIEETSIYDLIEN